MVSRRVLLSVVAAFSIGAASAAGAQTYPDKPIKLIVPFPPGGPIDTSARLVSQIMSAGLGQSVIVENRPGAGATIGTKSVAIAEPDGYTLLFGSSGSLGVSPALYGVTDYDPIKSFTPVATVSLLPHVLVVTPDVPAKTVKEFVAHAKANPGKLNYGAALGTPPHLLTTLFKTKSETDIVYIPYKGAAQSVTDLLGGRTQMTIDGLIILGPLIKDGKLRPLAVAGAERWPELPDVPTLIESGFPDFSHDAWTSVVAPAGTPPQIVSRLNAVINEGLRTPAVQASLARLSSIAKIGSPQDFAQFLAVEVPKWAGLVKLAGAKVQ